MPRGIYEGNKGRTPWNRGLKGAQVAWNKGTKGVSVGGGKGRARPTVRGTNHWNWKGGGSRGYREGYQSLDYKMWRMSVFERDNWTCQSCGLRNHIGLGKNLYLTAHHIKSWAHYPELRFEINNGIALCEDCHKMTDNYGGRGIKKR